MPVRQVMARWNPQEAAEFEKWAKVTPLEADPQKRTVWEWLEPPPPGTPKKKTPPPPVPPAPPVPAPAPPVPAAVPPAPGAPAAGTPPKPARAATVAEALTRAGLDLAQNATGENMKRLLDELRHDTPAKVADAMASLKHPEKLGFTQPEMEKHMQAFLDFMPPAVVKTLPKLEVVVRKMSDRGSYTSGPGGGELEISSDLATEAVEGRVGTLWHEMAHWLHLDGPKRLRFQKFFAKRCGLGGLCGMSGPFLRMKTLITITMPDGRMGQVWWEAATADHEAVVHWDGPPLLDLPLAGVAAWLGVRTAAVARAAGAKIEILRVGKMDPPDNVKA